MNRTGNEIKNVTDLELSINVLASLLIACVTISGNLILILLYLKFPKLRDLNNTAITMLSFTDFLRGCVVMTIKIYTQWNHVHYLDGFTCHLTALISAFSFVFSPLMLALISFVRYCKIVPHSCKKWNLTPTSFYIISSVLFTVAALFSIPPYISVGDY